MTASTWIVLDPDRDSILARTRSLLEAVRIARRQAGRPTRLERASGLGVQVRGATGTLTVFRVLVDDRSDAPAVIPGMPQAELIVLTGGGSFIWVPAA